MKRIFDANTTIRRLRNRYRLVIINDDTYEEVVTLRLTRMSVYVTFSTIFVVLVGLTVALITFTNLKYYLPGYGTQAQRKELIQYKTRIDSLEKAMQYKDQYLEHLKLVLSGNVKPSALDTVPLEIPEVETSLQ
ncbi:MAG: hypothetical protein ACK4E8_02200 [Lacibacter sp.]|jgi:hypothetical protein